MNVFTGWKWSYGDPHFQTQDGKAFDFQGRCSYYYLTDKDRSFNITITNKDCGLTADSRYALMLYIGVHKKAVFSHF